MLSYDPAANRTVLRLDVDGDGLEDARVLIADDVRGGGAAFVF